MELNNVLFMCSIHLMKWLIHERKNKGDIFSWYLSLGGGGVMKWDVVLIKAEMSYKTETVIILILTLKRILDAILQHY